MPLNGGDTLAHPVLATSAAATDAARSARVAATARGRLPAAPAVLEVILRATISENARERESTRFVSGGSKACGGGAQLSILASRATGQEETASWKSDTTVGDQRLRRASRAS